jgi:hypothetical protein
MILFITCTTLPTERDPLFKTVDNFESPLVSGHLKDKAGLTLYGLRHGIDSSPSRSPS